MTSVPERIVERREQLIAKQANVGQEWGRVAAEIAAIDFCIAAIEDAAKVPNAEAGEGERGGGATPQAAEAENASAGEFEVKADIPPRHLGWRSGAISDHPAKKPRAPKRDIRGLVLCVVEESPGDPMTPKRIAEGLGVPMRAVASAIEYWQAKGRLTLDGGVVRLRMNVPIEDVHGILMDDEGNITFGGPVMISSDVDAEPQQGEVAE